MPYEYYSTEDVILPKIWVSVREFGSTATRTYVYQGVTPMTAVHLTYCTHGRMHQIALKYQLRTGEIVPALLDPNLNRLCKRKGWECEQHTVCECAMYRDADPPTPYIPYLRIPPLNGGE